MMRNKSRMNPLQRAYHATFPSFLHVLDKELQGCKSILELGCGKGSPLKHIKKTGYWVGVDLHKPALQASKKLGIHDKYVHANVLETDFNDKSFDCVIALDLIEHLQKKDGYKLLKEMERIASKKIIVFTPNGFLPQFTYEGNKHQEHLSGWTVPEMQKRGYTVYGINGWKPLRGERTLIKWHPKPLWQAVAVLTEPLTYKLPKHAYQMFCVKTVPSPR